jgi:hypothetical protein
MEKKEAHITQLPLAIDPVLSIALGEMVVAYGRLEDMFKIAIKRLEGRRTLEQVIKDFGGMDGTIGRLAKYCEKFDELSSCCAKAKALNDSRQDFIHATFAADDQGRYVRFRELIGYTNLEADVKNIKQITCEVNTLIEEIDRSTAADLRNHASQTIVATVSVLGR